jgi:hypothetical protein
LLLPDFSVVLFASKFIGIFLNLISCLLVYLLVKDLFNKKPERSFIALASLFIYGISVEIVNTSMYLAPTNFGLVLIPAVLLLLKKNALASAVLSVVLALTHPMSLAVLLLIGVFMFRKQAIVLAPSVLVLFMFLTTAVPIPASAASLETVFTGFYPLFFILMIFGIFHQIRFFPQLAETKHKNPYMFSLSLITILMFFYILASPYYGARIITFFILPASIIAGAGLVKLKKNKFFPLIIVLLLTALIPATNYGYAKAEMTQQDYELLLFLRSVNTETVGATWQVSAPWVEAVAGKQTVLASYQETVPDYKQRRADLDKLFAGDLTIAEKYNMTHIYLNKLDEKLYPEAIDKFSGLQLVKENGYAYIFKVK